MRPPSFRIFSIIALILALVVLSGLASTVSAAVTAAVTDSCCDHPRTDTHPELPCPECYCPCASCLSCEAVETFSARLHPLEIPSLYHFISELHAKAFVESIDYPPESA